MPLPSLLIVGAPVKREKQLTVPMRFNRVILFGPWMFHNSASGFGSAPEKLPTGSFNVFRRGLAVAGKRFDGKLVVGVHTDFGCNLHRVSGHFFRVALIFGKRPRSR